MNTIQIVDTNKNLVTEEELEKTQDNLAEEETTKDCESCKLILHDGDNKPRQSKGFRSLVKIKLNTSHPKYGDTIIIVDNITNLNGNAINNVKANFVDDQGNINSDCWWHMTDNDNYNGSLTLYQIKTFNDPAIVNRHEVILDQYGNYTDCVKIPMKSGIYHLVTSATVGGFYSDCKIDRKIDINSIIGTVSDNYVEKRSRRNPVIINAN